MDTENGRIYSDAEATRMLGRNRKVYERRLIPMTLPPTPRQQRRVPPKVGRNESCPCGSGRKFKRCHLSARE